MILKSDNMSINKMMSRHKCTEELPGPLPDDETSMGVTAFVGTCVRGLGIGAEN